MIWPRICGKPLTFQRRIPLAFVLCAMPTYNARGIHAIPSHVRISDAFSNFLIPVFLLFPASTFKYRDLDIPVLNVHFVIKLFTGMNLYIFYPHPVSSISVSFFSNSIFYLILSAHALTIQYSPE